MVSYRKYGKRKSSIKRKSSSNKVTFTTADGKRVSFTPKKRRSGQTPPHLKAHTNKMKDLGRRYQAGEFGPKTKGKWKSVVKKHMKKGSSVKRRRSRR